MPQVRCPQCGAINGTGAPDYPFCIGCQDNLAKCGYCRWFDPELVVCTSAVVAGVFDVAADATPPCDQHAPRESILTPGRSIWPVIIVGLVALLVLVYSVYQFRRPETIPAEGPEKSLKLGVEVSVPDAVIGRRYPVLIELTNVSGETIGGIRLQISKESLVRFNLDKTNGMQPRPSAREDAGEWFSYVYPDMAPKEQRRITLNLVPNRPGIHRFAVRLVSRGATYHGLMRFPVRVVAAPAGGDDGQGGRAP